jgi:hypothetical protein
LGETMRLANLCFVECFFWRHVGSCWFVPSSCLFAASTRHTRRRTELVRTFQKEIQKKSGYRGSRVMKAFTR